MSYTFWIVVTAVIVVLSVVVAIRGFGQQT